jgi:hypothetical protein
MAASTSSASLYAFYIMALDGHASQIGASKGPLLVKADIGTCARDVLFLTLADII